VKQNDKKPKSQQLSPELTSELIAMAWCDKTSFEDIHRYSGLTEADIIVLMRRELKPGSFRIWRKRVSGRLAKHAKKNSTID